MKCSNYYQLRPRCILAVLVRHWRTYNPNLTIRVCAEMARPKAMVKYWFLRVQKFKEKFTSLIWGSEIFYIGRKYRLCCKFIFHCRISLKTKWVGISYRIKQLKHSVPSCGHFLVLFWSRNCKRNCSHALLECLITILLHTEGVSNVKCQLVKWDFNFLLT